MPQHASLCWKKLAGMAKNQTERRFGDASVNWFKTSCFSSKDPYCTINRKSKASFSKHNSFFSSPAASLREMVCVQLPIAHLDGLHLKTIQVYFTWLSRGDLKKWLFKLHANAPSKSKSAHLDKRSEELVEAEDTSTSSTLSTASWWCFNCFHGSRCNLSATWLWLQ